MMQLWIDPNPAHPKMINFGKRIREGLSYYEPEYGEARLRVLNVGDYPVDFNSVPSEIGFRKGPFMPFFIEVPPRDDEEFALRYYNVSTQRGLFGGWDYNETQTIRVPTAVPGAPSTFLSPDAYFLATKWPWPE
ncbi:MAG: hypothetical protein IPJ88_03615 [Myxococcales bacterium]|nr:MAG: hypothetical protein IPJ88_03615 [Myxococcales bacterium]